MGSVLAGASLALVLLSSSSAGAWEVVYGATPDTDNGARGVTPVRFCPGGGFISAGTRIAAAASDVYVVRTTAAGGPFFERRYDIGPGGRDSGNAIVELRNGTGFVIAGSSIPSAGGSQDALLMRIDCNGNLVWTFTYGSSLNDSAANLVEATSGNAAFGTAAGDLVIAGVTTHPAGTNTDALLFRVRANGALIWNRRYDINNVNEAFASLTETRPSQPGSPTGDIAAVGSWRSGATPDQGYVVRVSGDTGAIGPGNTCAAIYGGPDTDRFTAVLESNVGATAGQLLFVGTSSSTAQANDIYLVRSQPNPCASLAQRRIGAPATSVLGDESPADLRQLQSAMAIAPQGALALTGSVGRIGTSAYEAFLLPVDVTTLFPAAGRLFGDHAGRRDQGTSLFQVPAPAAPGFVLSGFSDSDFQGVGDARDMYLIRTDGNGNTSCNGTFAVPHVTVAFPPSVFTPVTAPVLQPIARQVQIGVQSTPFLSCP
jgi:hypothetical protein